MASYNTGTTASAGGQPKATPFTFTVPAGVLTGDVMLVTIGCFLQTPSVTSYSTPSSGGGNWTQVGTIQDTGANSGFNQQGLVFWRIATGSDAGSTFTISFTGTQGTDNQFWAAVLDSYTGFYTGGTPVGNFSFSAPSVVSALQTLGACPTTTTTQPGSWGVQFADCAVSSSGSMSTAPATNRQKFSVGNGLAIGVSDTNGSAGAVGSTIGGSTFTNTGQGWNVVGTIELLTTGPSTAPTAAPVRFPHPKVMPALLEAAWARADWQAQGVADLTVAFSSSSGGVDTWNVTSPYNGTGTHPMRVLKPTAPNLNYPHAFLIMLPVDPDQGTTFGDSIATAQSISAHNAFNLTVVQPGYAQVGGPNGPWYSDNPLNPAVYQETFTMKVTDWIKKNLSTSGQERVYIIGFSRSGIGGQNLLFRHPYVFAACASWDAPFMMTDYDGTDPTFGGTVGGDPADAYGTSANFTTNYILSALRLSAFQATGQYATNRIWLGQGPSFPDTPVYDTSLTTAGIPHTYTFSNTGESHAWQTDWVQAALTSIIPANYEAPSVLPVQVASHPVLARLLEDAAYRQQRPGGGATGGTTIQGTATLSGSGSLTASPVLTGSAALSGQGTLTAATTAGTTAALSGSGSLTAFWTLQDTLTLSGAGTLSAVTTTGTTAALSGTGTLSALWTLQDTLTLSGQGTLTVSSNAGSANLTGTGTLTAAPQLAGSVTLSGLGTLTAAPAQTLQATAALSGLGTLTAAETLTTAVTLTGLGTLTVAPAFQVARSTAAVTDPRDGTATVTAVATSTSGVT